MAEAPRKPLFDDDPLSGLAQTVDCSDTSEPNSPIRSPKQLPFSSTGSPSTTQLSKRQSSLERKSISGSFQAPVRSKVVSDMENPLSDAMSDKYDARTFKVTKENLIIRKEDELRIVASLHKAARKQTNGSIFSVVVDLSKTGTLGIGVKDLPDHVLAVSMLKRDNCQPGAGEDAGTSYIHIYALHRFDRLLLSRFLL